MTCCIAAKRPRADATLRDPLRDAFCARFAIQPVLEKLHIRAMLLPKKANTVVWCMGEKIESEKIERARYGRDGNGGDSAVENPMSGQTETQSGATMRRLTLPSCPKCNDLLCAPTASEFVSKDQVRHQWSCEACGHEFSTSVRLFCGEDRRALS